MDECGLRSPELQPFDLARGRSDASAASAAAPLDLHKGIDDPPGGCKRWPEHFRLLNETTGELVRGRCRATNLCRYCQTLYVVETVEMLTLDAMEHAPVAWVVLTAREHLTRAECRRHLAQLLKAARKLWPEVAWFVQVEFQRRGALHLNLLVKGVPVEDVERLRLVLVERWCARVDAEPVGQWAEAVQDGGGVVFYLSKMLAHGLKAEQRPPMGWRGHRTSQTRGYLVRPAAVMREEARAALREKRRLWKAFQIAERVGGARDASFVEFVFEQLEARELEHASWRLVGQLGGDPGRRLQEDARRPLRDAEARALAGQAEPRRESQRPSLPPLSASRSGLRADGGGRRAAATKVAAAAGAAGGAVEDRFADLRQEREHFLACASAWAAAHGHPRE